MHIKFFFEGHREGEGPPPEFHSFIGPELAQQIVQKGLQQCLFGVYITESNKMHHDAPTERSLCGSR